MPSSTDQLLADAARRAASYLDGLDRRPIAPSAEAIAALAAMDVPLPEGPSDAAVVLEELDRRVSPATMAMAGPRFFGFVIGGALPATLAANVLATAWDQNSARWAVTPGTAAVERVALRWTLEALGLPPEAGGGFVTGATVANFTALAAARRAVLARAGWDVEARGLFGAPPIAVVVGAEAHVSVLKALAMLGLGRERVITVPVDGQGRMRPDAMPPLSGPAIVCLQAGNVNSGAFDPAPEAIARARAAGAWVHVDGAFGLWAAAAPGRAHLMRGFDEADSWATDAHKWLNVPYDSGLALVREPAVLSAAMGMTAAYLPDPAGRDPADFTPELSRRARRRDLGGAPQPRPRRPRRDDRALLPPRGPLRRGARRRGPPRAERGGAEPGAGLVRRRRADPAGHRGDPGGRHLLVRGNRLAGPGRHADQRLELGDHGGGRGALARGDAAGGGRVARRP